MPRIKKVETQKKPLPKRIYISASSQFGFQPGELTFVPEGSDLGLFGNGEVVGVYELTGIRTIKKTAELN